MNQQEIKERLLALLESNEWPNATDPSQICGDTEEDKQERAQGIIEVCVNKKLQDMVVLDYGCGEGHVAREALNQGAALSVGYDIASTPKSVVPFEERNDNLLLTTDFGRVKANTYDVIILYDVLDHSTNPTDILTNCKSLLRPDGEIYVRCHPFCSRHGGHTYKILNKAFVHLVLKEKELSKYEVTLDVNQKVLFPLKSYEKIIKDSGLIVKEKNVIKEPVEGFFKNKVVVKNRLAETFGVTDFPEFQMSVSFIDYVLGQ